MLTLSCDLALMPVHCASSEKITYTAKSCQNALQVLPVPGYYLRQHQALVQEFQNSTYWPKHLLVRYHWTHNSALNVTAALYVLFGLGEALSLQILFVELASLHPHAMGLITFVAMLKEVSSRIHPEHKAHAMLTPLH